MCKSMDFVGGLCESLVGFKEAWYNEVDSWPTHNIMTHSNKQTNNNREFQKSLSWNLFVKVVNFLHKWYYDG